MSFLQKKRNSMFSRKELIVFILISFFCFSFAPQIVEKKMSVSLTSKLLKNGKKIIYNTDVYYHFDKGIMITHNYKPFEYYMITDAKGEIKMYYPDKNEVYISRDPSQITEHSIFYYFLANRLFDFGLRDLGFTISKTEPQKDVIVTRWAPPKEIEKNIKYVELVHQKNLPIYMAYFSAKNKISRKIYYYDYTEEKHLPIRFPKKIVEFNYLDDGDSLITQMIFSNIQYGKAASSSVFEFKIPLNAKIVKQN